MAQWAVEDGHMEAPPEAIRPTLEGDPVQGLSPVRQPFHLQRTVAQPQLVFRAKDRTVTFSFTHSSLYVFASPISSPFET